MASVVLFHSVLGLRPVEFAAADMIRRAGHNASAPDLYDGAFADTIEAGMALKDEIGWDRICERAARAVDALPPPTVLAGLSMGCGVVASLWSERREARGVLLLHALADIPDMVPFENLRAQLHLGEADAFWSNDTRTTWQSEAARRGLDVDVFVYPSAEHFYTDPNSADYQASAAARTWERVLQFLDEI